MKKLLLILSLIPSISMAEIRPDLLCLNEECTETKPMFIGNFLNEKLNRDEVRVCDSWSHDRVCVDGVAVKEICKIIVNGIVVVATRGRGEAQRFIMTNVGMTVNDIVCSSFSGYTCIDVSVCEQYHN